jgi:hypothetical protein
VRNLFWREIPSNEFTLLHPWPSDGQGLADFWVVLKVIFSKVPMQSTWLLIVLLSLTTTHFLSATSTKHVFQTFLLTILTVKWLKAASNNHVTAWMLSYLETSSNKLIRLYCSN